MERTADKQKQLIYLTSTKKKVLSTVVKQTENLDLVMTKVVTIHHKL